MKNRAIVSALTCIGIFVQLSSTSLAPGLDNDVLKYTNQFRKSKGLSPLTDKKDLDAIARRHSEDMAEGKTEFGHGGFDQRFALARKSLKGITTFAENVAVGVTTGKAVVGMWEGSPGHRQNMLGNFRYIGIGTARNRRGVIYYTEVFAN